MILGTAGHVDHGKTALVKALTGVDTDRLAEELPRGGERGLVRVLRLGERDAVQCAGEHVEELGVRFVRGAESEHDLGHGARAGEAAEVVAERGSRPRHVESAQRLELAPLAQVQLGGALREEIHRGADLAAVPPRAAREHGLHAGVARGEAEDARGLRVIEGVEDDRVGLDERHA